VVVWSNTSSDTPLNTIAAYAVANVSLPLPSQTTVVSAPVAILYHAPKFGAAAVCGVTISV
jgi:hypothetical protein